MKDIISIGALVTAIAMTGCSADTEYCANRDNQDPKGKQSLELLTKFTNQNVTGICASRNGVKESTFTAITEDGNSLHIRVMWDNTLRVIDIKKWSVITIVDNKDGTFTSTDKPLITTDKVEISKK